MKKLLINIILIITFIFSLSMVAFAEPPAPFAKAKEMALKVSPDFSGRYFLTFKSQDTSYTFYIIGYSSQQLIIGVGKTVNGILVVAEYFEQEEKFTFYMDGKGRYVVDREKVIDFAFQVFRELVAKKLI